MTDATQQGVSNETPHDRQIRELQERREAETKEGIDPQPEEQELPEQAPEAKPEADKPPVKTIQFRDADGKIYEVPESAAARLKIDGEEYETPIEQITRRYQKGAAGDKRLEEANRAIKAVQQKEAELETKRKAFENAKLQAQKNLSAEDDKKALTALKKAIVEADEEVLDTVLPRLFKKSEAPAPQKVEPDPKLLDSIIDAKIAEKERISAIKSARKRFNSEYADLAADTRFFDMVDKETVKVIAEKPDAEPWDIIHEAAETVKKWKESLSPVHTKKKTTGPTPISARAQLGAEEPKQLTRREQLNQMRIARGQPPL